jgi:hypothetical protein
VKKISLLLIVGSILSWTIFFSFTMFAETQKNFSGKWSFNQINSKAAEGTSFSGSDITMDILHENNSITVTKTIKNPGGMVDTTSEKYTLDGKETVTRETSVITKMTGNWSSDKLILVKTVLMGSRSFTTEDEYSLSDNGKVLTIQSTETMNSKKSIIILVYDKK